MQVCNPSIQEVEVGGEGFKDLFIEFEASLGYNKTLF